MLMHKNQTFKISDYFKKHTVCHGIWHVLVSSGKEYINERSLQIVLSGFENG
jgi:hypothetical protein